MTSHIKARIKAGEILFRWVQFTPVAQLKSLSEEELEVLQAQLIKEVREVGRALHWIDGIIRLKALEEKNSKGGCHE